MGTQRPRAKVAPLHDRRSVTLGTAHWSEVLLPIMQTTDSTKAPLPHCRHPGHWRHAGDQLQQGELPCSPACSMPTREGVTEQPCRSQALAGAARGAQGSGQPFVPCTRPGTPQKDICCTHLGGELPSMSACSSSACGPVNSRSSRKPPSVSAAARCASAGATSEQMGAMSDPAIRLWLPSSSAGASSLMSHSCVHAPKEPLQTASQREQPSAAVPPWPPAAWDGGGMQ